MIDRAQLVCRTADAGGDIDPLRAWLSVPDLRGKSHLIFLIHGYNDTVDDAQAAYASFRKLQAAKVAAGLDWTFGATLVEVFWPGDARWGIARPAFYPWALPLADKTAELLSEIVKDLCSYAGGELTIDLVCHSVGNRVAMRMLSLLGNPSNLVVRRAVHMAAAVPVGRLETQGDEFSRGLADETAVGKAASFYSSDDDVLAYAFPLGETADFPQEGVLPVALGHRDWPLGHSRPGMGQFDASPAGHGDYWFGDSVQTKVRDVLDLGVSGPAETPVHATPVAAALPARGLEARATQRRQTGQELYDASECGSTT